MPTSLRWLRAVATASTGLLVGLAAPAGADLYEWTDEAGRTHYSNEPRPGARPVGLDPIALPAEGGPDETPSDTARRDRRKRQRAERLIDADEHAPAAGMIQPPAAANDPLSPEPTPAEPAPPTRLPDLSGERSVAPMAMD